MPQGDALRVAVGDDVQDVGLAGVDLAAQVDDGETAGEYANLDTVGPKAVQHLRHAGDLRVCINLAGRIFRRGQ